MLIISSTNGDLRGLTIQNKDNNLEISHFLYVNDDAFMPFDARFLTNAFQLIRTIFEGISGLHVNWRKSQTFYVDEVPNCLILAGILGCEVGALPMKYLGLSLGPKKQSS